jgi:quercetin dioxygenase-like cupin family protein
VGAAARQLPARPSVCDWLGDEAADAAQQHLLAVLVAARQVEQGPTTADRASIEVDRPAGAFELVHLVLDFNPGVWTPKHLHGGQELAILTAGDLTLQRHDGLELFTAGDSWVNTSGLVHAAGNDSTDFAQVVATFLLPAGRICVTAAPPPGPVTACRSMLCVTPESLALPRLISTVSPSRTRSIGPGTVPSKVQYS